MNDKKGERRHPILILREGTIYFRSEHSFAPRIHFTRNPERQSLYHSPAPADPPLPPRPRLRGILRLVGRVRSLPNKQLKDEDVDEVGPPYPRCRCRRARGIIAGGNAPSSTLSSAAVDSSSIWAAARSHARQSPANRMHCKINVGLGQSHCSSRSLAQKSTYKPLRFGWSNFSFSLSSSSSLSLLSSVLLCFLQTDRQRLTHRGT